MLSNHGSFMEELHTLRCAVLVITLILQGSCLAVNSCSLQPSTYAVRMNLLCDRIARNITLTLHFLGVYGEAHQPASRLTM
jgi:predicted signal transduction protein with EAL and GGDEF domain